MLKIYKNNLQFLIYFDCSCVNIILYDVIALQQKKKKNYFLVA